MQIESNSRQIPSDVAITSNKDYSDLLYGYLQTISELDPATKERFILKKNINYGSIATELEIARQTVSKRFNSLLEEDLIRYDEKNKRYILLTLRRELATLLPNDTVRILCNTLKERSLSILAYLLKTYVQHGSQPCEFNLDILKTFTGLSAANRAKNNEVVKDVLLILKQLNFISYHAEKRIDTLTGGYKTVYILDWVDNKVRFSE